jgi:tetratricopeptide (TPR) repeat protein
LKKEVENKKVLIGLADEISTLNGIAPEAVEAMEQGNTLSKIHINTYGEAKAETVHKVYSSNFVCPKLSETLKIKKENEIRARKVKIDFESINSTPTVNNTSSLLNSNLYTRIRTENKKTSVSVFRMNYTKFAAAASIILVIGIAFMLSGRNSIDINSLQYSDNYGTDMTFRSSDNSKLTKIQATSQLIRQNKDDDALVLLNEMLMENGSTAAVHFYKGEVFAKQHQYSKALKEYNNVVSQSGNEFIEQAQWHIGFCHLNNGDKEKAIKRFTSIANSGSFYGSKAEEVISQLN